MIYYTCNFQIRFRKEEGNKMLKRVTALIVISSFILAMGFNKVNSVAAEKLCLEELSTVELSGIVNNFDNMSIEELNDFITRCRVNKSIGLNEANTNAMTSQVTTIKLAWMAAAAIARQKGYECSATLVEHSVQGNNYNESGMGLFARKIISSNSFTSFMNQYSNLPYKSDSSLFEKSDNADLFYSIHKYDIEKIKAGVRNKIYIRDRFNFEWWEYDGDIFTTSANNWAYLCQNYGVLNDIGVIISFDY